MKISVTQSDVDNGAQCDAFACPVALAIRRKTRWKSIAVGIQHITSATKVFYTPDIVKSFINDFDLAKEARELPGPFEFELGDEQQLEK